MQRWEAFLHHRIWDTWRRYFRVRGIVPPPPYCKPDKHYMFAHFPHAGICVRDISTWCHNVVTTPRPLQPKAPSGQSNVQISSVLGISSFPYNLPSEPLPFQASPCLARDAICDRLFRSLQVVSAVLDLI